MFDERNRRIFCLPFSLIFPTSLEGYHAGTLKDSAVNYLNERECNVSSKKLHNLSWLIISLNIYTIVTIQWILEITIPRF